MKTKVCSNRTVPSNINKNVFNRRILSRFFFFICCFLAFKDSIIAIIIIIIIIIIPIIFQEQARVLQPCFFLSNSFSFVFLYIIFFSCFLLLFRIHFENVYVFEFECSLFLTKNRLKILRQISSMPDVIYIHTSFSSVLCSIMIEYFILNSAGFNEKESTVLHFLQKLRSSSQVYKRFRSR